MPSTLATNTPATNTTATNTPAPKGQKTQPWRAVWPGPDSAGSVQCERKIATSDGGGGRNGQTGLNDKGELLHS